MSSPHRSLAARFRTAVRRQREHEDDSEVDRLDREAAARHTREALLDELEDFAEAAEFFAISRAESSLLLRYSGRRLRFESDRREPVIHLRNGQLRPDACLRFHPKRRIWQVSFGGPRRLGATVDLFPRGLERLISLAFDILPAAVSAEPVPEKEAAEPQPAAPAPASRFWRTP